MKSINGHSEYFLMRAQWGDFVDARNGEKGQTQMMPLYRDHNMTMHHIYPPVFPDIKTAIHEKLEQLKLARFEGNEFNVKGTIECAKNPSEILEFFKDRKLVITKRHDMVELVASTMFAVAIKAFHMRPSNREQYLKSLENPITLSPMHLQTARELLEFIHELWQMENLARDRGMSVHVTYYEDLDTKEAIREELNAILETDEWIQYVRSEDEDHVGPPILIEKDYKKLITNYDELKDLVENEYATLQKT